MQTPEQGRELVKLHSTLFTADGDGPKTTEDSGWFKRHRHGVTHSDGTSSAQPVPTVKHKKLVYLKKLFNVGEKLKPLGIGDKQSGANYDGQAPAREQEDEEPPRDTPHVAQDEEGNSVSNEDINFAEEHRDIHVQVIAARNLKALDSNGSSDPYCRVQMGQHKVRTKTINKDLTPLWNETFVFPASSEEKNPRITFELWDSDFLAKDQFLGQAHVDLGSISLKTNAIEPMWLPLCGEKTGREIKGLGDIKVALWLSPSGQLGRLDHAEDAPKTKLTTLCNPPGVAKTLPLLVHTQGNCLYEEPCMYFLSLHIEQVRDLEQFFTSSGRRTADGARVSDSFTESPNRSIRAESPDRADVGSVEESPDGDQRPNSALDRLLPKSWRKNKQDGSSSDNDSESEFEDDGKDPFEEEDSNFENPLQVPSSEANSAPPSAAPMRDKRLYFEVSFGSQRRRTKIARLKDRAFTWSQGLAFAATVPMKDRTFKLLLCEVDRQNQKSRLLAIAFIRLSKLWAMGEMSDYGDWFKLHDYTKRSQGKPVSFGAVRLRLRGTDADERRQLYGLPFLEPLSAKENQGTADEYQALAERSYSTASVASTEPSRARLVPPETVFDGNDTSTSPARKCADAPSEKQTALWSQYGSSIAMYLGARRSEMEASVLSAEHAKGLSKMVWQALGLLLLLLQFLVALAARAFWSQNTLLKRSNRSWRRMMRRWTTRRVERRDPNASTESQKPAPDSRPLGLVKLLLSSVELIDQPSGSYFCVLKCGPHWGQTSLIRNTTHPRWDWEVHLPLYDPHTLVLLVIFRDPQRKLKSSPPVPLGKLRVRFNSLVAGSQYTAVLPMLSDRKSGGQRTAMAHLQLKVIYFAEKAVIQKYFKAALPSRVYELGFHVGDVAKQLDFDQRRLTKRWLETTQPPIPKVVANSVLSSERKQFVFSRAKANWTRFVLEKERFMWIVRFWQRNQKWENPAESLALMAGLITFSFHPQIILSLVLLSLVAYALLTAPKRPEKPPEMRADPQDEEEDDEVADKGGIVQLRKKYERLVRGALAVQNYLEDLANTAERLHAFINWADPKATLIFLFICLAVVLAMAAFSLPVVLSFGLCWTVRPPCLRSPTPPAPLSFFLRLPTRSDQII